jgi:dedicator of cytokinesis protein 1
MIAKLDILVEGGRGDEHYKELFGEIMLDRCENHSTMKDQVQYVVRIYHHHPLMFPPLWIVV